MKRFYKEVTIAKEGEGFAVLLDGRPIKTPGKVVLLAGNEKLAGLAANEWSAQDKEILPDTMPVTQFLNTKIDRVSSVRASLESPVLNYINTDLLCYQADHPEEIVKRQNDYWQPWLDWFEKRFGEAFETTNGLSALKQPKSIHDKIGALVSALDDDRFTIFQVVVPSSGSIILALAFLEDAASVDDVMRAVFAEEDYKFDLYNESVHGGDPLTEKKKKALRRDLEAAKAYLKTLS